MPLLTPVTSVTRSLMLSSLVRIGPWCGSGPGANRALVRIGVEAAAGSADPNVVVRPDALHDQEAAAAVPDARDVMRRLRPDRDALADLQHMRSARRPRLDLHRSFQAEEGVGDFVVVVPGPALAGRQGQDPDPQVRRLGDDLALLDGMIGAGLGGHGFRPLRRISRMHYRLPKSGINGTPHGEPGASPPDRKSVV